MKLDIENWKKFRLGDIFIVSKTKNINSDDLIDGETPYVTRTVLNNGIDRYVESGNRVCKEEGNCITIGGESAWAFYQKDDFLTGNNITRITNEKLNKYNALFLCSILNIEHYRYSYGRAWNKKNIENTMISLPQDLKGNPNWERMEKEIKDIYISREQRTKTNVKRKQIDLNIKEWKYFKLSDVFKIYGSKFLLSSELANGNLPFVSKSIINNGVETFVDAPSELINNGNCITIGDHQAIAFYQESNFVSSDHLNKLYSKNLNKYNGLFICKIINCDRYRFAYGRIMSKVKAENAKILLPSKNNQPDWQFMENYIKQLPNSDLI